MIKFVLWLIAGLLLAAGTAGLGGLSVRLARASAVPRDGHRSGWRIGSRVGNRNVAGEAVAGILTANYGYVNSIAMSLLT